MFTWGQFGWFEIQTSSLKKVLSDLKPSVFFITDTKYKNEGNIKVGDDFVIYELVRKDDKGGGGLALGCLKDLNPCWVSEGNDQVEALSVDIFLKNIKIRCCVAYGPRKMINQRRKKHSGIILTKRLMKPLQLEQGSFFNAMEIFGLVRILFQEIQDPKTRMESFSKSSLGKESKQILII